MSNFLSNDDNNNPILSNDLDGNSLLSNDLNGNSLLSHDGNGNAIGSYDGNGNIIGSFNGNGNAVDSGNNNGNTVTNNIDPGKQEQQQQEQQQQQQESSNYNHNDNSSWDSNGNLNTNANLNSTDVTVSVDVTAQLTPVFGQLEDAIGLNIPQTYNQNIDGALSGSGTQTEIALDQINSLVANNEASGISNATDSWSVSVAADTGEAHAGDISQGSLNTGELQANTSTAASVDAFTQSIVLGANIQNNSFTTTITGHDSHVEAGAVGHS
jgi:hypothetical protein